MAAAAKANGKMIHIPTRRGERTPLTAIILDTGQIVLVRANPAVLARRMTPDFIPPAD
jgi:hypothetical protein